MIIDFDGTSTVNLRPIGILLMDRAVAVRNFPSIERSTVNINIDIESNSFSRIDACLQTIKSNYEPMCAVENAFCGRI